MSEERFLNSYRNASTPPPPDLRPDLAANLISATLGAVRLHLPDYREKLGLTRSAGTEVPT
jgi:hypothetical protein